MRPITAILFVALCQTSINAVEGDNMKSFACFKNYPNVANPKIKEAKLSDKLPEWNLSYLYKNYKDKMIFNDIKEAVAMSKNFRDAYISKIKGEALSSYQMAKAIKEYEAVWQKAVVPMGYLSNIYNVELNNEELKALNGKAGLLMAKVSKNVSFFENGIARTSDNYKKKVLSSPELDAYRNFLNKVSARKKHLLPEELEELIIDKDINGSSAWSTFRKMYESKYSFMFKGPQDKQPRKYSLTELVNLVEHKERNVRQTAAQTYLTKFGEDSYVYAHIYNSIIQDMILIEKDRRGYSPMISVRNEGSQLDSAVVEAMHKSVAKNFKLAQKYWKLKAKILGIKDFNNADVYAPYETGKKDTTYTYSEAINILQKTFDEFYPPFGSAFENMYRCSLVHAKTSPDKRGGAYCDSFGHGIAPVVLVNYQGNMEDISTIAHEGGHWIHFLLIAEEQTLVNSDVPMATAETASVFNEMLLATRLIKQNKDKKQELLSFLMGKLDRMFATVYRQTAFSNFEQAAFKASENGPLTPEQFSDIFVKEYGKLFGDAVKMTPQFRYEWARIPHFMRPFYVYAYAFGELATIALYQDYLEHKDSFPKKYMDFLAMGSVMPPAEQFKTMGVDLKDEKTWDKGFKYIETLIKEVEKLSGSKI